MHQLPLFDVDTPAEAIGFIRESIGDDTAFVGFSGGKDSIVTARLMEMSGVEYELCYSMTGIDAPEVVRFIRKHYPHCRFLKPRRSFWLDMRSHVQPSDRLRWCCTSLKKDPSARLPYKKRIMGIRAEEGNRSRYGRVNDYFTNHTQFYPIFHWKEWQVWEFIEREKLAVPPLYKWGFDRIGCVICPYHSEKTGRMHAMYRDRWPGYFRRFEKEIAKLYDKRVSQGRKMFYPSARDFLGAWYLDDSARWYAPVSSWGRKADVIRLERKKNE